MTSIADKAFKNCKKLTAINIGDNVKKIGKEAFSGCKKLKTMKIGKNVTTIGDKTYKSMLQKKGVSKKAKFKKI